MKFSKKGLELLKQLEGFRSKHYLCSAGVPTIGYGSTRYSNGVRVSLRDPEISETKAIEMLIFDVAAFEKDVTMLTKSVVLTQNQFDALVLFAYNVGSDIDIDTTPEGLGDSALLKKVLHNPCAASIASEFMKWVHAGGKISNGLIKRRKIESNLYFAP
ncbi:MAG: lysozyme [Paludibacter sp.]